MTAPATAMPSGVNQLAGDTVLVPSRLFGPLRVRPETFIVFPDGLLGFAGERRFILLPAAPQGVFWLQSADEGTLAFLLVDPFLAFPGYEIEVPDTWTAAGAPPLVLAIATLGRGDEPCTVNLQAPIVFDLTARVGRQLIASDNGRSVRETFDLHGFLASRAVNAAPAIASA